MTTRMLTLAALAVVLTGCEETYDALDVDLDTQRARDLESEPDRLSLEGRVADLFTGRAPLRPIEIQVVAVHRDGPVEVLAETHTEKDGTYAVVDLPTELRAPLYVVVDDREDGLPAVATPVLEQLADRAGPGEPASVDVYSVEPRIMLEILDDLEDLKADIHIEDEGAIIGSVRDGWMRPVGHAQVGCDECRETWYFDANPRDGHFTRGLFDLPDDLHRFDHPDLDRGVNRITSERAGGLFLTSGPELAMVEAQHPSSLSWPRYAVPTMPAVITIVDLVAFPPPEAEQEI